MSINCSPIFKNVFDRKNIKVTFEDNFSTVWISNGEYTIPVEGNFFQDVFLVMSKAQENEENEELKGEMLWNIVGTSQALPYDNEEFLDD